MPARPPRRVELWHSGHTTLGGFFYRATGAPDGTNVLLQDCRWDRRRWTTRGTINRARFDHALADRGHLLAFVSDLIDCLPQ